VKIVVEDGEEQGSFSIHKQILITESKYFNTALTNFQEGVQNEVLLEEMSLTGFMVVAEWFYRKNISTGSSRDDLMLLIDAYIVADRLVAIACKNELMDSIRSICQTYTMQPRDLILLQNLEMPLENYLLQFCTDEVAFHCALACHTYTVRGEESMAGWVVKENGEFFENGGDLVSAVVAKILALPGTEGPQPATVDRDKSGYYEEEGGGGRAAQIQP